MSCVQSYLLLYFLFYKGAVASGWGFFRFLLILGWLLQVFWNCFEGQSILMIVQVVLGVIALALYPV
jgi:hypothetical protein